jgi:hypothetical protein
VSARLKVQHECHCNATASLTDVFALWLERECFSIATARPYLDGDAHEHRKRVGVGYGTKMQPPVALEWKWDLMYLEFG